MACFKSPRKFVVQELPLDPFTDKNFVYRREEEGFIVYSLGDNVKDDRGRSEPDNKSGYPLDIVWKFDE